MIRCSNVIRSRSMAVMRSNSSNNSRSISSIHTHNKNNNKDWNNHHYSFPNNDNYKNGWVWSSLAMVMSLVVTGVAGSDLTSDNTKLEEVEEEVIVNWSGTHSVHVKNVYEPRNVKELEDIVRMCHIKKQKVRPMGSALSPNALSFQSHGMIRLDQLDQILKVDTKNQTVTVQAGARVSQVLEALRPYNLTLPNLASIAEQQMGGFIQVGAHGTGATISSIDHYITSLTMVTPAHGTITFTNHNQQQSDTNTNTTTTTNEEFQLAKVGLGSIGIVTQMTLQCIPSHSLKETTICMTRQQAKQQLQHLLQTHKHVRYMWIPYTDTVVVVINDPTQEQPPTTSNTNTSMDPLSPLKKLVQQLSIKYNSNYTIDTEGMGFADLRDILLAFNPLNTNHIKTVNQAEANFWKSRSNTTQIKPSDQLLQFDCGGQQWVLEVCFPTGTYDENNGNDMRFMEELLHYIESNNIPAPAPIEQRWSRTSSSLMSPSHSNHPQGLHTWVGVIMYLPLDNEEQRKQITKKFSNTYAMLVKILSHRYGAVAHWAKLETPISDIDKSMSRSVMHRKYPMDKFNALRSKYDPHNILTNPLMDTFFHTDENDEEPQTNQKTNNN